MLLQFLALSLTVKQHGSDLRQCCRQDKPTDLSEETVTPSGAV
jgi:hypothetical protein